MKFTARCVACDNVSVAHVFMAKIKRIPAISASFGALRSATWLTILQQIYFRFSFASTYREFLQCAARRNGHEPPVSHVKLLVAPANSLREETRQPYNERERI